MNKPLQTSAPSGSSRGFTIVELLIVIVVIGILATLILVGYRSINAQAKVTVITGDLTQAGKQLGIDKERTNAGATYPATLAAANNGGGIAPSTGNTSAYYTNSSLTAYCLNESNGTTTYYISSQNQKASSGSCASAGFGAIGWWPLNGNATDISGNGLNGLVVGPTSTTGADGTSGGAYNFATNTDRISLPTSALLNNSVFTFSAWIKPTSLANNLTIVGGSSSSGPQFRVDATTTKTQLLKEFTSSIGYASVSPALNTWTNVQVTYDASGNYAFYTNGTLTGSGTSLQSFTFSNLQIGKGNGTGETFIGAIDDIRIFNRPISATDALSIYNAGPQ